MNLKAFAAHAAFVSCVLADIITITFPYALNSSQRGLETLKVDGDRLQGEALVRFFFLRCRSMTASFGSVSTT